MQWARSEGTAAPTDWPAVSGEPVSPDMTEPVVGGSSRSNLSSSVLRLMLELSRRITPDLSLESFTRDLAHVASTAGRLRFAVVFFFDPSDDAFYAEAMHNLSPDDWQEILATAIPRRVYLRVAKQTTPGPAGFFFGATNPLLEDAEVRACFGPLFHCGPVTTTRRKPVNGHDLLVMPLGAPGSGTIGLCIGAVSRRTTVRPETNHALAALLEHGAALIATIRVYRMQQEEAAIATAVLQVADVVGTTDIDQLVQRTLTILPHVFGAQFAGLLYLDLRRVELRMLEPKEPTGELTAMTEVKVTSAKLEQLAPVLRGSDPVALEQMEIAHVLPERLVQARGLRSALIIPLDLPNRPADAIIVLWTDSAHRFRTRDLEVARGVSRLVGVALANAGLFADATARAEQLSSLYRTGQMMSSSLDLDAVLRTITAAAVQLTRSRLCFIYLIDPKSGLLDYVAGAGLDTDDTMPSPLRPGEGLLGRCALSGKPLLVNDLQDSIYADEPELVGDLRAALFLPLIASGEVIGVLGTGAELVGYFLAEHQQILQAFANQAALAIERARLYALEQRRRELAELQQTMTQALGATLELRDVLGQVLRFAGVLANYDLAAAHVINGNQVDLGLVLDRDGISSDVPFHGPYLLNEPLYRQMYGSLSAIVVGDSTHEPLWRAPQVLPAAGSWIGVPLLIDGDYLVVLDLYNLEPGAYTQEDADTINQFAHQVGFAVRNARIYAREHEAKTRLEELDQLRTDFVSTVSHELRTPLTGIKGFTETLLTYWTRLDDERRHHYLDRIYGASKRLQRLVQDLLFVSKVEGGSLPLTIRRVKLEDLIGPAVMEVKQKYRGQVIAIEVPEDLPPVLADGDRAQQVLVNLMDNAVKYSPEGSDVEVRCIILPDEVKLIVTDHGPGIRSQDMHRLFTRFGKIDQVIRAGHVGTGLGLFISKQLVEQMNGAIAVSSTVGEGSEFSFTLPRADR